MMGLLSVDVQGIDPGWIRWTSEGVSGVASRRRSARLDRSQRDTAGGDPVGRGGRMRETGLGGWQLGVAAAVVLAVYMPSSAGEWPTLLAGLGETSESTLASTPGTDTEAGAYRLLDARLDYPVSWRVAQAAPTPGTSESVEGKEAEPHQVSASELSRQLSNPVTSLWSLTFEFNNYQLENGEWNYNLLFEPVLPIGLTKDLNLITRPVIPLYNSVPHETVPGEFERTTGFGDIILLELLSPAHSGHWILGAGPTFIFPTATSDFTGQGKWHAGPSFVVGYLTKKFILGVFPQQWWSFAGDSSRPDTSQMNLQPFAAWFFGEGWRVAYSGNILADWKAPSNNRWTVPIGVELGKVVKLGRVPVNIAIGVQYMPIRPDNVGQEWNFQLLLVPVIPKLIKEPLFK
jgi:hypothetical protein